MKGNDSLKAQFFVRFSDSLMQLPITQKEFADKVNITQQTLSRYKKGDRLPDTEELHRLSKNLGVTTDWLLGSDESSWKKCALAAEAKLKNFKFITAEIIDLTQEHIRLAAE